MLIEDSTMEEVIDLPERMFAVGHEPVGLRVISYGPTSGITAILEHLDPVERTTVTSSCFGKFIGLAEKPNFSSRFVRFLLSRMLKVNKKHEIWFLFAGKPVRFSLREFALVTGLPCGEFPEISKKKRKNNINETPHWPSLFGSLESVTVESVLKMLKRRTVDDTEIRKKFAYLALLASVVLPTTHTHKIVKEHVNLMKNMDELFAYPWGSLAFDMIIKSVKERNEITLSQNTIAIKGFVYAMQLVMVEAVPTLLVNPLNNISSESESEGEGEATTEEKPIYLSPSQARRLNDDEETAVESIIAGDGDIEIDDEDIVWSDETDDPKVTKMESLINVEYDFVNEMFTGGATKGDVKRMLEEGKAKNLAKDKRGRWKQKKHVFSMDEGGSSTCHCGGGNTKEVDIEALLATVAGKVMVEMKKLRASVVEVNSKLDAIISPTSPITKVVSNDVCNVVVGLKSEVINAIISFLEKETHVTSIQTETVVNSNPNAHGPTATHPKSTEREVVREKVIPSPTINHAQDNVVPSVSLNKTAHGHVVGKSNSLLNDHSMLGDGVVVPTSPTFSLGLSEEENGVHHDILCTENSEVGETSLVLRSSKRSRRAPLTLVNESHGEKHKLRRTRDAFYLRIGVGKMGEHGQKFQHLLKKLHNVSTVSIAGMSVPSKDFAEIGLRDKSLTFKIVDLLINHTSKLLSNVEAKMTKTVAIFDSHFVGMLSKYSTKASKPVGMEDYVFPKQLLACFTADNVKNIHLDQFYFPFNFDQIHWIGICVDCVSSTVVLLDCDLEMRTDDAIKKEVSFVALMLPYLLKQVGRLPSDKEPKAFSIERPKTIPQNGRHVDSAVTTVLLIQAHAIGGVEMCRCITPNLLEMEAKGLAVLMYEAGNGPLV